MNPESWKVLEAICEKTQDELTQPDIDFLRARRFYLTSDLLNKYEDVLRIDIVPGDPDQTEENQKIVGLDFKDMNMEQLKIAVKHFGLKLPLHFYKDPERVRLALKEEQERRKLEAERSDEPTE